MTWESFFSDYEAKMRATEAALDNGEPLPDDVLGEFVPPSGLGTLPPEMQERAVAVLKLNLEIEQRLKNELDVLGRELGRVTRDGERASRFSGASGTSSTPTYIDHSA